MCILFCAFTVDCHLFSDTLNSKHQIYPDRFLSFLLLITRIIYEDIIRKTHFPCTEFPLYVYKGILACAAQPVTLLWLKEPRLSTEAPALLPIDVLMELFSTKWL